MTIVNIIILGFFSYVVWNGLKINTGVFSLEINGLNKNIKEWKKGSEYRSKLKETQKNINEAKNEEELVEALKTHPNYKEE